MDDFSLIMRNLPRDLEFEHDEEALKACLNQHFEELIKREAKDDPEEEEEKKEGEEDENEGEG